MNFRFFSFVLVLIGIVMVCNACRTTEQVRKGYNVRPVNSPAAWESNPYGVRFQN